MKKAIRHTALMILLALAGASIGCGPSTAVNAPFAPPAPASAMYTPGQPKPSVSAGHIRVSDRYVVIDAAYPIVSGMRDESFQAEFNKVAEADMREAADKLCAGAKREYNDAREKGYEYHIHTLESSIEPRFSNGTLLSFGVRMELYEGGAHPFPDSRFYTLENSMPAKRLALPQLFTDPAAGTVLAERLVRKELAANPGEYFDDTEASVGEETWYYLTCDELHIVFPAYSIAPGAAGEPDIGLPLALFSGVLIPGAP